MDGTLNLFFGVNHVTGEANTIPALPPTRVVRLRRRAGEVIQDCDVYIGRECQQGGWNLMESKWVNPFTIKREGSAKKAIEKYASYLNEKPELLAALPELRGKTLGCWCAPSPCHGDILARLVNALPAMD